LELRAGTVWVRERERERERESELAGGALTERELAEGTAGRAEVREVAGDVDEEGERETVRVRERDMIDG
jgi:hypothetical protein